MSAAPVDDLQSVVRGGADRGGDGDRVFRRPRDRRGRDHPGHARRRRAVPDREGLAGDHGRLRPTMPGGEGLVKFIWPLAFGTIVAATIAIVIAVPMAVVGRAVHQPHRAAPDRAADELPDRPAGGDPERHLRPLGHRRPRPALRRAPASGSRTTSAVIPFFKGPASATGRTMLVAGVVLAVMILPIITAVTRSVFEQTPRRLQEGALALGATRWEMIRLTVLPFGRSAIISASMLGLGRALGETMAVAIVLSVSGGVTFNLIGSGEPVDDRGEHRARLPGVLRRGGQRADRLRPCPLRRDAAGQHGRAHGDQPPDPDLR